MILQADKAIAELRSIAICLIPLMSNDCSEEKKEHMYSVISKP
jgi:hypothetical protein